MSVTNENTVIREVTKGVWTFSTPFKRSGIIPFGGRSTAVQLKEGGVWVLASTPLNDVTKSKLAELGDVRWIIGADAVHYMFLNQFKKEYPNAKVIAVADAASKVAEDGLKFDGAWGSDPPDTKYGFEDDIQHCYFSGFRNKDVAFFHPASKTLIEADLLLNLPPTEQYSKSGTSGQIPFLGQFVSPWSGLHKRMVWYTGVDKEAMKRDARTVAAWDFERIIPCHGDVIEKNGKKAWTSVYEWYLKS
ncbi:hypothetical protein QCA50_013290 [Cerrena zonata]|uniref:Uncharacterized protein n=1 Tax=Cerrena zonata TaxID=2478898 RepID=A0AAW0G1N3_9APHY